MIFGNGSIRIWEADACGNRFLILAGNEQTVEKHLTALRFTGKWSFDSALVLAESGNAFRMSVVERDGSVSDMCGNGARAVGHVLECVGVKSAIEVGAGILEVKKTSRGYAVPLGKVVRLPWSPEVVINQLPDHTVYAVSREPHAVIRVNNVNAFPLSKIGPQFTQRGVNCTVFSEVGSNTICARTFERGVERETHSCGTGATAAAWSSQSHRVARGGAWGSTEVRMSGQSLWVHLQDGEPILEGPATARLYV